jgi:catechol 2,3-dioxygenase-like lactoylglutathione lyase family enzyme
MTRVFIAAAAVLAVGLVQAQPASQPPAQAAPPPAGPAPTGLVVGNGNWFSPIVADLDKALVFYRDGLGFETMGAPGEATGTAPLMNMFGLPPEAKLHYQIARPPASRTGVEIVEVSGAGGKPLDRGLQDPGAFMLIVLVRDIDAALVKVKAVGAPVLTRGGMAMTVPGGAHPARMAVVKDPDGHFVELAQLDPPPETQAPASANVIGVRVRLIVDDVDKAMKLYHDALGMSVMLAPSFKDDSGVLAGLGLRGGQYRAAMLQVPTTGLVFELMDFKDLDRKTVHGRIQDAGSTRIQLQVRDVDAAIAALKQAGGVVQTTGGKSMDLPAGPNTIKVAVVRDPNDLNVVLIQAAAPATAPK